MTWPTISTGLAVCAVAGLFDHQIFLAPVAVAALWIFWQAAKDPTNALALLGASFFFENYLSSGVGLLTPQKALGLVPIGALILSMLVERRKLAFTRDLVPLVFFSAALLISGFFATDSGALVVTLVRYASFLALYFITVQTVAGDTAKVCRIIDGLTLGAAVAAAIGVAAFLSGKVQRASGPIFDPNDFGFLLVSVLPLSAYRFATLRSKSSRLIVASAMIVSTAAVLATLSRSAGVGVAVGLVWLAVTGKVRLRTIATAVVVVIGLAAIGTALFPSTLQLALAEKSNVASGNVSDRIEAWHVAVQEWQSAPVFGVGPGNFPSNYSIYHVPFEILTGADPTTHNAYLNILADLGIFGLGSFAVYLVSAWMTLTSPPAQADEETVLLYTALAASFVISVSAAMFLTEQFYFPLWLIPALAAGLSWPTRRRTRASRHVTTRQRRGLIGRPELRNLR